MLCYVFNGDTNRLLPLLQEWVDSSNSKEFNLNVNVWRLLEDVAKLIRNSESDLLVLEDRGRILGLLGLCYYVNPLGKGKIADEHYWFVIQEVRGVSSIKLLANAKKLAKDKGCTHMIMHASMLASNLHDSICNIYKRMGMKKFETSYIQEV